MVDTSRALPHTSWCGPTARSALSVHCYRATDQEGVLHVAAAAAPACMARFRGASQLNQWQLNPKRPCPSSLKTRCLAGPVRQSGPHRPTQLVLDPHNASKGASGPREPPAAIHSAEHRNIEGALDTDR